jgi:hypothetical protein
MFRHEGTSSGNLSDQRIKIPLANLGLHRPHRNDYNSKILKSIQILSIIFHCFDIKTVL